MKYIVVERYADNGEFSHYDLINTENGETAITDIEETLQLRKTDVMACCSKKKKEYKDYIGKEFIYTSKITRAETWFKVIAHFERAGRTVLVSENNNGYYLDEVFPYNKP